MCLPGWTQQQLLEGSVHFSGQGVCRLPACCCPDCLLLPLLARSADYYSPANACMSSQGGVRVYLETVDHGAQSVVFLTQRLLGRHLHTEAFMSALRCLPGNYIPSHAALR